MPRKKSSQEPREPAGECLEKNLPCWRTECGSSDGVARYSDPLREYCFVCRQVRFLDGDSPAVAHERQPRVTTPQEVIDLAAKGEVRAIRSRGLTQETCRKFDYRILRARDGGVDHLAIYRDANRQPAWIKVRHTGTPEEPRKEFAIVGHADDSFFGQHLWPLGGRRLVIVGGEIDAMTVSQAQDHQWPVWSPAKGEQSLARAIRANLPAVSSFDEVCIGLDQDAAGREATQEALALLPPGKAKVIIWPRKDPNEMLLAGEGKNIIRCIWNAEAYRPDGIVDARTLTEQCLSPVVTGIPWPWEFMTSWTFGRRGGEVYTFGGGTGIGKTDLEAEIIASTLMGHTKEGLEYVPEACAAFVYEAGAAQFKKAIAGKLMQRRFHIPKEVAEWTDEELRQGMTLMDETLWARGGKLFLNNFMGAADWESVKERSRWAAHAEGVKHIFVDPISALVEEEQDDDERKFLDRMVREAAKLAVELNASIYLFSHLTRPQQGPSHEEGGQTSLKQFRGSNGIGMFSNFVFGLERNQQADDEAERCQTRMRVLKDRYTGNSVGKTERLYYDVLAGTLDTLSLGALDE